jgi:hypothetical protein
VAAARDLAFAPRGDVTLASFVVEDVPTLGLHVKVPVIERKMNVPLSAYVGPYVLKRNVAMGLGLLTGLALLIGLRRRAGRPS